MQSFLAFCLGFLSISTIVLFSPNIALTPAAVHDGTKGIVADSELAEFTEEGLPSLFLNQTLEADGAFATRPKCGNGGYSCSGSQKCCPMGVNKYYCCPSSKTCCQGSKCCGGGGGGGGGGGDGCPFCMGGGCGSGSKCERGQTCCPFGNNKHYCCSKTLQCGNGNCTAGGGGSDGGVGGFGCPSCTGGPCLGGSTCHRRQNCCPYGKDQHYCCSHNHHCGNGKCVGGGGGRGEGCPTCEDGRCNSSSEGCHPRQRCCPYGRNQYYCCEDDESCSNGQCTILSG